MDSKAQISAEFFILMGFVFLVAIAFEIASIDQLNDFRIQKENDAVQDLALKLQKEVILAASVEDGYSRTFSIPLTLDNINYTLTRENSSIAIQSKNSLFIIQVPNSIGNLTKGINTINKTGGVIYISNVKSVSYFSDFSICQNAQNNGLCGGLDIAYGAGYQAACCSEHVLCC